MQYRPVVGWSINSKMNVAQCEMFAIYRAQPKVYDPNYFQKRNGVNGRWTKSPHPIERYCRQLGSNTLSNHCAMCPAEVDEAKEEDECRSLRF
jgi:hypothetical protein